MKTFIVNIVLCGFLIGAIFAQSDLPKKNKRTVPKEKKEICITFDDLPVDRVDDRFERMKITDAVIGALAEYSVKAAGFVVGRNIEGQDDLLEQWLSAGHILGNMTYSKPDLNDVPVELYIQDIKRGSDAIEKLLIAHKQKNRYFRYPLLHYGQTFKVKDAVSDYLDKEDIKVAHVSVTNDEYIYNLQYEKLYETADSTKLVQLGAEYIDHIIGRIHDSEKLAYDILGSPIKHILLLHVNRLNAEFLSDLLGAISNDGYTFISLDQALTDPVYHMEDGYVGYRGLSFLERLAKSDPDFLPAREQ